MNSRAGRHGACSNGGPNGSWRQSELLELLSGVRRLPLKEARILSEEHKAVLLVVMGYRQKGGVSKLRVGEILGLEASYILGDLLSFGLIYCDGPTRTTAALPQISPVGPVKTPFPRTQRRPLESCSPAQRFATTRLGWPLQQLRAHHSGKNQSRFSLWGSPLSEANPAQCANSPSVPRRSISRLSRREASVLVLSKKRSSFAIIRISFRTPKFNSLDGSQ